LLEVFRKNVVKRCWAFSKKLHLEQKTLYKKTLLGET
jgi:hypothetical protein